MRKLFKHGPGLVGLAVIILLILVAVFAPVIAPHSPVDGDLGDRLLRPGSPDHILGTDVMGRDLASLMIYGARVSLLVGFGAALLSAMIGTVIGLVSGYYRGWLDRILMRLIDVQLSFPFILLAITIASILGASLKNIMITLVLSSWVTYARLVRGEVLTLREMAYVEAATALGMKDGRIMLRHILPNVLAPVVVVASLEVGRLILTEAAISFLGFGVQPGTPAWGSILNEGREYMTTSWWLTIFPGVALTVTAIAANLVGDWLRDVYDPRLRQT
jgi:peptide/nickel transport system permease protein